MFLDIGFYWFFVKLRVIFILVGAGQCCLFFHLGRIFWRLGLFTIFTFKATLYLWTFWIFWIFLNFSLVVPYSPARVENNTVTMTQLLFLNGFLLDLLLQLFEIANVLILFLLLRLLIILFVWPTVIVDWNIVVRVWIVIITISFVFSIFRVEIDTGLLLIYDVNLVEVFFLGGTLWLDFDVDEVLFQLFLMLHVVL